jgi:hypothetical protein
VLKLFLNLDFYGDLTAYNTQIEISNINDVQISNSKIDEIRVDEEILSYTNSNKSSWDYNTILLAPFNNETQLEAGNIVPSDSAMPIEYIRFKKRLLSSLSWMIIEDVPFNPSNRLYSIIDRLCQSTEEYEYSVTSLTSGIQGKENTVQILCDFEGVWLVDKIQGVQFNYNLEYSDIESVTKVATFEPLQSQYPYTQTTATDYHKSSIGATIISADTLNGNVTNNRQMNIKQERLLRESIFTFLKNRKPKILKDGNGRYYLIQILNSPRETPMNELQGAIAGVKFDWIEIGDAFNNDTLKSANLV